MRIVECVPNFSEGRDEKAIKEIARALEVSGAQLLDVSWDSDHNRSVMTLVGDMKAVAEGAFRGVKAAVELIDMERHSGDHPRMGAADVVPFVPVKGVTLEECVGLARDLGGRISRELGVPVYLYGAAATSPERRSLGKIRKGQYEGLKTTIKERLPDYGLPVMHRTAGAIAVGARNPLVAYNVNLASSDMEVARAIARSIRTSSGGLPHVMATAVELRQRGQVQVSMNLTDPSETPVHRVYGIIEEKASSCGVEIAGSEIIGLVPLEVLLDSCRHFLRLEEFPAGQVMESRLLENLMEGGGKP